MLRSIPLLLIFSLYSHYLPAKHRKHRTVSRLGMIITSPMRSIGQTVQATKQYIDENFHMVEKNAFYRSAQLTPKRLGHYIEKHGIKTVINLRGENPHAQWWLDEQSVVQKNGVEYYNIPMSASRLTTKENLLTLLDTYDNAQLPILVHCYSGVDRTGEATAIWVMEKMGKSKRKALAQLSLSHRHLAFKYPAKSFLINIWQGRNWLIKNYNHLDYPQFAS